MHEPPVRPSYLPAPSPPLRAVLGPRPRQVRRPWLRLSASVLVCAAAAVAPFLVPNQLLAYLGFGGVLGLLLSVLILAAGGGSLSDGVLDGDVLMWPTTRGTAEIDLARLRRVDANRVRTHEQSFDQLLLTDAAGRTVVLPAAPGFPDGHGRGRALTHRVYRRVGEKVAAGEVRTVSSSAVGVLGLPPGSVRTTAMPRARHYYGWRPVVLGVLAMPGGTLLLLGYVHLLSYLGLAKPFF